MGRAARYALALPILSGGLMACQSGSQPHDHPSASEPRAQHDSGGLWLGASAILLPQEDSLASSALPVEPQSMQVWQVRAGDTVASTVRRWADQAGYVPLPDFSAAESWNFIVTQDFSGSFEAALKWLSEGFRRQPMRPVVILFSNHTLDLVSEPGPAVARADGFRSSPDARSGDQR